MNKFYKLVLILVLLFSGTSFSQVCNPSGNLLIYSNYDGGIITINCDVNIPNIKIGICTYEAAEIHITGTFSSNVTGVMYAGYDGGNDNCSLGVTTTTIIGVSASIQTISVYPAVGAYNPVHGFGNPNMDGCYQCDTTQSSGGVNSPDEVVYYFQTNMPGTMRYHWTDYGCWTNTVMAVSNGGNCCILPANSSPCVPPPTPTNITVAANQNICTGGAATLAVSSGTTVNWFSTPTSTPIIGVGTSFITNTLSAGNYTYYAAAVNSCSTSVRVPISVTVNALPTLTVNGTTSICSGQVATLTVSGANTYSWSTSQTATMITVTPASTAVYTVTGTSLAGCKNTATLSVNVVTCTILPSNDVALIEFGIFPNPAKAVLNVTSLPGKKKLQITDLSGKIILEKESDEMFTPLDVSSLAKGVYVFIMIQNDVKYSERLLIE